MNNTQQEIDQRALYAVAVQFLINGMVIASYVPRLPEIRDSLSLSLTSIGQVLTVASLGGLLGSWLAAKVINRFGTKNAMIYGSIAVICTLPLIAVASSIWALFFILTIIMMLDPIVDVAMNIQGSNISARRDTPVMNRLHGLWSLGSVIGGLLAASMAALAISLQWHLLGASLLMSIALFYVGRGLLTSDAAIPKAKGASDITEPTVRVPVSLWVFAILGATALVPEIVGSDWAPFRMSDDLQKNAGVAGMGYVAFTVGMVIGRFSGDWVVVKLGKTRQLQYSVAMATVGLATACLIDIVPLVFMALTVSGVGISILFPALYDAAAQDSQRPSAALGALTAGSRGITLVAPISIGLLADTSTFSVGMAMAVFALPCLLIMAYLAKRNHIF